jgi:hypothetical protein
MKRRIFLKTTAGGAVVAALGPAYPSWPMSVPPGVPEATAALIEDGGVLGFPLKVRPVGYWDSLGGQAESIEGPLTTWFPTHNDAKFMVIENMDACTITGIQIQVSFDDMDFTHETVVHLPTPAYVNAREVVTLNWNQAGIIDPLID